MSSIRDQKGMTVSTIYEKYEFWVLVSISILFILGAPSFWHYTPDGGIYIGTAQSLIETGKYHFNGHPNLLYYPGFSVLLLLPISIFGIDFHVLHTFCAAIVVVVLWLTRAYFTSDRYGFCGVVVPILLACSALLQRQVFTILSDATFLAIVLGALYVWRIYCEESHRWTFISCLILVAFAPMVRFQGLFLCFAFTIATFLHFKKRSDQLVLSLTLAGLFGLAILIPFTAWTIRNFLEFTPDTFNMANAFFFKQRGLRLYAPEFGRVDGVDPEWMYGLYQSVYSIRDLAGTVFDHHVVNRIAPELVFVCIVSIILLGSLPWFKKATLIERFYVIFSMGFLIWSSVSARRLHVIVRYWLPVFPFVLMSAILGISIVYKKLRHTGFELMYKMFGGFLIILILSNGVYTFYDFVSPSNAAYYRNASDILSKAKEFMDEETSSDDVVATTDWGVMPFTVKRRCIPVLNDKSHLYTLERMYKFQAEYLVILDGLAAFPPETRKMVKDFPRAFHLLMEAEPNGNGPMASIYRVDLEQVQNEVDNLSADEVEAKAP